MANTQGVEIYTTEAPAGSKSVSYKGLIVVNKSKSRNMFSDIGAGFKSMVGGEIKAITKLTRDLRNELILEAVKEAKAMGANAITGMRMETSTVFEGILDIVLYGTAVYVKH